MAEVHKHNRNLSQFEFYNTALDIFVEVSKLTHREKVIPKSRRFTHAVPMVDMARSMVYNITRSDKFYPNTAHGVQQRKHYLTLAMADCEQLAIEFGLLLRILESQYEVEDDPAPNLRPIRLPFNLNALQDLLDLINTEYELLKGARKGVRLVKGGKEEVSEDEERIADLEEQVSDLQEQVAALMARNAELERKLKAGV